MNGHERLAAALQGRWPDRIPVMLHNFQMAARENSISMGQFRRDPQALAEAFIAAVERYGYDGVVVDVDTATLADAAGVPVDLPLNEPARVKGRLVHDLREVGSLAPVDLRNSERAHVWLEGSRLLKQHFGDELWIRGNCDQSPFTLAALLRGMDHWMIDLLDPDRSADITGLLEYCYTLTTQFIALMAETGVDMVSNGDSTAGPAMISPALYRRFALPYEKRVVAFTHQLGLPYLLHICGDTGPILEDMMATGADGLELDYKTDVTRAHALMRHRTVFVGNIDPSGVLALGSPEDVTSSVSQLLHVFADTPRFVLNAGCALPPDTPSENIRMLMATARGFR